MGSTLALLVLLQEDPRELGRQADRAVRNVIVLLFLYVPRPGGLFDPAGFRGGRK